MGQITARCALVLLLACWIGLSSAKGKDHKPIDCSKETNTEHVIVKWHKRPVDAPDFFRDLGYDLEWIIDIDEDYTVYRAPDNDEASSCMKDLLAHINPEEKYESGYTSQKTDILQHYVYAIFGEGTGTVLQAKPAALAAECGRTLPDACPSEGLYGLNLINAPAVWNALPGIVNSAPEPTEPVMVIDDGVRATHRDLAPNLVPGASVNYYNLFPEPIDYVSEHGNHVSGTIFGAWNNGDNSAVGVVGRALGMACRCGPNYPDMCIVQCLKHALERRVRVINMSFGGRMSARYPEAHPLRVYMERFAASGGLTIISAGNDNRNILEPDTTDPFDYPALFVQDIEDYPKSIIVVANVDSKTVLAEDSNYGDLVKVAAPGEDILSATVDSDTSTGLSSGTSMAAPHVAGVATLLFNAFPDASTERVYDCIVDTATTPVKRNSKVEKARPLGGGLLDLKAAYECMYDNPHPQCPTHGLPACVVKSSGVPVAACDTKNHYCNPLNDEAVCQYTFAPDNTLCKHQEKDGHGLFVALEDAELAAAGLEAVPDPADVMTKSHFKSKTCGVCKAGKCHTNSRKYCKKGATTS